MERNKLLFIGTISLGILLEVIADILFKKSAVEHRNALFLVGLAIYAVGTIFWAISLRYEALSKSIVIFAVMNAVCLITAGYVLFKEKLTGIQLLGAALGILGVIFMEL